MRIIVEVMLLVESCVMDLQISMEFLEKPVTSLAQIQLRHMERLPHGQSTLRFQQVSRLAQLTVHCMERQLPL